MHLKVRRTRFVEILLGAIANSIRNSYMVRVFPILWILLTCRFAYAERQVSQFGITWTFERECTVGRFANGDNWVIGPVTIIGIEPPSTEMNGRTMNGSMVNPSPKLGSTQGYDNSMYGKYSPHFDPNLNVARPNNKDLSASNPLIADTGCSLVSTISMSEPGHRPQLKTAAILTVLAEPAPEGSFRPPYCGTDKTIKFNKSQLDYSLLTNLKPVPNTPSLTEVERYFEHPWIDHVPGWIGGFHHPVDNMPHYGREIATQIGIGALMLHLNFTEREKETLLVRFVQLGIDIYGVVQNGGKNNWPGNGGHASGRKWPILFAGLVLNDADMKNIGSKSGDYLYEGDDGTGNSASDYIHFGEDDQTFYVSQIDVNATHLPHWGDATNVPYIGPDKRDPVMRPYEQKDIGLPEWGIRVSSKSNKWWTTTYRRCCTANSWAGFVLAAHIMGVKDLWNHDSLFDYMDRYMQIESIEGHRMQWTRQKSRFVEYMWDYYRPLFGKVWQDENVKQ
jgi:hypothetical protein